MIRMAGTRKRAWPLAAAGVVLGLAVAGCDRGDPAGVPAGEGEPPPAQEPAGAADAANPARPAQAGDAASDPKYSVPFAEAAITEEIPDGMHLPPDVTSSGKSTGLLRLAVEEEWPKVRLVSPATGELYPYRVVLATDLGEVEITLRPDIAPNHVRNFIALARVGYYDGLCFDRVVRQEADDGTGTVSRIDLLKAGCPLGTGEDGYGHIGYFLRPEFSESVKHEEGTVGFWHGPDPTSAGCRFYITLGPAPLLDGQFTVIGRVTRGMDVVRAIAARPVLDPESPFESETPKEPVVIRKAAVVGGE